MLKWILMLNLNQKLNLKLNLSIILGVNCRSLSETFFAKDHLDLCISTQNACPLYSTDKVSTQNPQISSFSKQKRKIGKKENWVPYLGISEVMGGVDKVLLSTSASLSHVLFVGSDPSMLVSPCTHRCLDVFSKALTFLPNERNKCGCCETYPSLQGCSDVARICLKNSWQGCWSFHPQAHCSV